MEMTSNSCELPYEVNLKDLEQGPVTIDMVATTEQCAAIAGRLSVEALNSLSGSITLEMPAHPNPMFDEAVIDVRGSLTARLTQICVVTLEPFETTVESEFHGVFSNTDPSEEMAEDDDEGRAAVPDILGSIEEETILVGETLIEQLALEIDPFPRKPGAEFSGYSAGSSSSDEEKRESPFAVLEKLKDNLE